MKADTKRPATNTNRDGPSRAGRASHRPAFDKTCQRDDRSITRRSPPASGLADQPKLPCTRSRDLACSSSFRQAFGSDANRGASNRGNYREFLTLQERRLGVGFLHGLFPRIEITLRKDSKECMQRLRPTACHASPKAASGKSFSCKPPLLGNG